MAHRRYTLHQWAQLDEHQRPADARVEPVPLGHVVMTRAVNDAIAESLLLAEYVLHALHRHTAGDWGELDPADWRENDRSLEAGYRLLSSYPLPQVLRDETGAPDDRLWIITEADRSATTILWPSDY